MPQQFPAAAIPARFRWCVDGGVARHGTHPNDPDLARLHHALLCPARTGQEEAPELTPQLAHIRTALGVAHRKLVDAGFVPAALPETAESRGALPAQHDEDLDQDADLLDDVRHVLAHGDTWLHLTPGRIENLQCVAVDAADRRCVNPVYRPGDGAWRPVPIPAHGSRTVQAALEAHAGTMWVWSLHADTEATVMRWYRQRCPDHTTPRTPAVPIELTPYDPVRHSHYILGDRPHGYDAPTAADGVHDDGRQQCAGPGCTNGNAGPHRPGWLCWTCRPAAARRRRPAQSRWRALVAELQQHPTPGTPYDTTVRRGDRNSVHKVLSAMPAPVVRALGGTLPHDLTALVHDELDVRTPAELADRIERRWGARWANVRLRRHPRDTRSDSYSPHDVARHLLAPTDCTARCEDGWSRDFRTPCPTCRDNRRAAAAERRARAAEYEDETGPAPTSPYDRTTTSALTDRPTTYTECEGRNGSCGAPVRPPHTACPPCRGLTRCGCGTFRDPGRPCTTCRM